MAGIYTAFAVNTYITDISVSWRWLDSFDNNKVESTRKTSAAGYRSP